MLASTWSCKLMKLMILTVIIANRVTNLVLWLTADLFVYMLVHVPGISYTLSSSLPCCGLVTLSQDEISDHNTCRQMNVSVCFMWTLTYPANHMTFRILRLLYQITAATITITSNNTITGTTVLAMMVPSSSPPSLDLDSAVDARKHHWCPEQLIRIFSYLRLFPSWEYWFQLL